MIPKIIHYCWFGSKNIPEELENYISSWRKYCPDYEIILWNEKNFNLSSSAFTRKHYENKNYAFVSDYVRMHALYFYGGIYLDTDVEVKKSLDCFLIHDAFAGLESKDVVQTAVLGCKSNHILIKEIIDHYDKIGYKENQEANTLTISSIIFEKFNIRECQEAFQVGSYSGDSIAIYPPDFFCIETTPNYTVHHFHGSWINNKGLSTKKTMELRYHLEQALSLKSSRTETIKAAAHAFSMRDILRILLRKSYYALTPNTIDAWIKNHINNNKN